MISIVIVTYNRWEYTCQCLASIQNGTNEPFELIIADNGSTDGTREHLVGMERGNAERVTVVLNDRNLGCAEAYNQGFRLASGDPIFRIDNDVILPAGWASTFMRIWEDHPDLGMMTTDLETQPRQYPERVGAFDPCLSYFEGLVWHDAGLGSWCIAHRRAMFEQIGYYRMDFGPFALNDNDLERRAQLAGWKIGTLSRLVVGHLWTMEGEEAEREYNHWKMREQQTHIATWNRIWGTEA